MNQSPDPGRYLVDLDRALSRTYRDFLNPDSPWRPAFFSDSVVLAAPCTEFDSDELAVGSLVTQAAILQFDLALQGFFVRGGLSLGDFHLTDRLIFGPALVSAYEIESQRAVYPRIVLDSSAVQATQRFVTQTDLGELSIAPLMRDGDGEVFADYLGLRLDDPDPLIREHRDMVALRLRENRPRKLVWEKYRWVAEYHNAKLDHAPGSFKDQVDIESLKVSDIDRTWQFSPFS